MSNFTDDYIESYLRKQLPPTERKDFKKALASDKYLRHRMDELRDVVLAVDLADLNHMRKVLSEPEVKRGASKPKWWLWGILPIFALASYFLWPQIVVNEPSKPSTGTPITLPMKNEGINETTPIQPDVEAPLIKEKPSKKSTKTKKKPKQVGTENGTPIYAGLITIAATAAYETPANLGGTRGNQAFKDDLNDAGTAIKAKNATKALQLLKPLYEAKPNDQAVTTYLAHAYFIGGDYESSARLFRTSVEASISSNPNQLEWYLLLAILAENDAMTPEAKGLLDRMRDPEEYHNYQLPAKKLVGELER